MGISVDGFQHPETKAEVIEAYQEQYRGRGSEGWRQHLISDIFDIRYAGLDLSADDIKKKRKNIARRFDPSRRFQEEPRNRQEYKDLGKELPLIIPESISINGTVRILYSKECEERDIEIEITDEEEIKEFMNMMRDDLTDQAIVNAYQEDDIGDLGGYAPCEQNKWNLAVIAA